MPRLSRLEVEDLLYAEARLLDDRRYEEWLAALTPDASYWIPQNGEGGDPAHEISIIYDDIARLKDRVARLGTGMAHAQSPPSKTRRLVSNVQIIDVEENRATVSSVFLMYELRRGRERIFAGRYEHRIRWQDGGWRIAAKKAVLVNNDEVIDNLTFIV